MARPWLNERGKRIRHEPNRRGKAKRLERSRCESTTNATTNGGGMRTIGSASLARGFTSARVKERVRVTRVTRKICAKPIKHVRSTCAKQTRLEMSTCVNATSAK